MTKFNTSIFNRSFSVGFISLNQKALLAKNLSVMQKSGIDIVESLSIIIESTQGRLQKILEDILLSVKSGNTLADSFARHSHVFSGIFISSIYAGEKSGSLAENLENLSITLKKEKQLLDKIKGAMLYPTIVLGASFALAMAMSFLILPKIIPLLPFNKLLPMISVLVFSLKNISYLKNVQEDLHFGTKLHKMCNIHKLCLHYFHLVTNRLFMNSHQHSFHKLPLHTHLFGLRDSFLKDFIIALFLQNRHVMLFFILANLF